MSVATDQSDFLDDTEPSGSASPISSKSAQWKFKSKYLDMELEADEALRLQIELQQAIRASKKKAKVKVPTRLLQPTASFKQSEYQKPSPKDIDVREVGWNSRDAKATGTTSSKIRDVPSSSSSTEPGKSIALSLAIYQLILSSCSFRNIYTTKESQESCQDLKQIAGSQR
jgi:hypothetical protein